MIANNTYNGNGTFGNGTSGNGTADVESEKQILTDFEVNLNKDIMAKGLQKKTMAARDKIVALLRVGNKIL